MFTGCSFNFAKIKPGKHSEPFLPFIPKSTMHSPHSHGTFEHHLSTPPFDTAYFRSHPADPFLSFSLMNTKHPVRPTTNRCDRPRCGDNPPGLRGERSARVSPKSASAPATSRPAGPPEAPKGWTRVVGGRSCPFAAELCLIPWYWVRKRNGH